MINPNLLKPQYFRKKNYGKGYYKQYYPCFTNVLGLAFVSKRYYRTAKEALDRAKEIHKFWLKLYDRSLDATQAKDIQNT